LNLLNLPLNSTLSSLSDCSLRVQVGDVLGHLDGDGDGVDLNPHHHEFPFRRALERGLRQLVAPGKWVQGQRLTYFS
jgi:hypothetical protein